MGIETELASQTPTRGTCLAIGVFDGVHLGHRFLLKRLLKEASREGLLSGVITFRRHPQEVLAPDKRLASLTSVEERAELLRELGIEFVLPLNFTPELASLGAGEFIALLQKHLRMQGLVIGPDFALGRGREGNIALLRRLARERGFRLTVVEPKLIDGKVVSSTAIRQALAEGNMKEAGKLLGRPFTLKGQVVSGKGLGKGLGFPTANLDIDSNRALPSDGVYVTFAFVGKERFPSVMSIGVRPTFSGREHTVEVYLLDFQGDLYGREMKIEVIKKLREERAFPSPQELKAQIARDIEDTRKVLEEALTRARES